MGILFSPIFSGLVVSFLGTGEFNCKISLSLTLRSSKAFFPLTSQYFKFAN